MQSPCFFHCNSSKSLLSFPPSLIPQFLDLTRNHFTAFEPRLDISNRIHLAMHFPACLSLISSSLCSPGTKTMPYSSAWHGVWHAVSTPEMLIELPAVFNEHIVLTYPSRAQTAQKELLNTWGSVWAALQFVSTEVNKKHSSLLSGNCTEQVMGLLC